MSKTDTWMALYIGDYLADTMRLTTIEHGAYLLLLMEYWRSGPLPDDDAQLAAIVKMTTQKWKKNACVSVRRFFHLGEDGMLHQKRADIERAKTNKISLKRADSGQNGAAKRWENHSKVDGKRIANAMANEEQTNGKRMANGIANAWQSDGQSQSQLQKEEVPPLIPPPRPVGREKKTKPRSALPNGWRPSAAGEALAAEHGLPLAMTLARFTSYHASKGSLMASWEAAWRTWCLSPYNEPKKTALAPLQSLRMAERDANQARIDEIMRQAGAKPPEDDFFGPTLEGVAS